MSTPIRYSFTRSRLDTEPAPVSGRKIVWDDDVAGLCCRITPDGARSIWLSKWAMGSQRWIRLGSHPECNVKDARAHALELLSAIARGGRPWETRKALSVEATLTELWHHYFTHHAKIHKRASSLASDVSIWQVVLEPWAGKKRLSSITRADVQRLITAKGKEAPIRANRAAALLSTMFNRAINAGLWIGKNPVEGVQRFKEQSRDRFLKPNELRAMFASLSYEDDAWNLYFRASILCGARRANMLAMSWADIDLERGLWRVSGEESKNGEPLTIILPIELVTLLSEWRQKCSSPVWVFPSDDAKNGHKTDPKKPWARLLARAECFRLLSILAPIEGWEPEQELIKQKEMLGEAGRLRLLALGRHRKIEESPLHLMLKILCTKIEALGHDASGGTMLDVRIHDLRRTLGSWAAMTGATSTIIGKALGHKSQQATAIYARLDLDPVRAAVGNAAAAIMQHDRVSVLKIKEMRQ